QSGRDVHLATEAHTHPVSGGSASMTHLGIVQAGIAPLQDDAADKGLHENVARVVPGTHAIGVAAVTDLRVGVMSGAAVATAAQDHVPVFRDDLDASRLVAVGIPPPVSDLGMGEITGLAAA